jgi:hypothetical protein
MSDNKMKRQWRDALIGLVAAGANPNMRNQSVWPGHTDREFIIEAHRRANRYDWDGNSFWDALKGAELYVRTFDNNAAEAKRVQEEADRQLAESRKQFTTAIATQSDTAKTGGVISVKTGAPKPLGKKTTALGFSPAVAVGCVAVAFIGAKFLTRGKSNGSDS